MKLLENQKIENVKIYLTASGGPFLNFKTSQLKNVKPKQALKHPKWKMGKKFQSTCIFDEQVTRVIEAQKLFSLELHKINIVIHPHHLSCNYRVKKCLYKFIYHKPQ